MQVVIEVFADYFGHLIVAMASITATYCTLKYQLKRDEMR